jgi:hypothetical protein
MRLSEAQSRELLRVHGDCITESCDRCGAVLGSIRWTIHFSIAVQAFPLLEPFDEQLNALVVLSIKHRFDGLP